MAAKLSKTAAAELVEAHVDYLRARAALDAAEANSKALRKKHRARVPYGSQVDVAGYRFRRSARSTGRRFSLGGYLKTGKKITADMRPFVSPASTWDLWEIEAIAPDVPSIEALVEGGSSA